MDEIIDKLMAVDPLYWARTNQFQVRPGVPFVLDGMPYLSGLVNVDKRIINVIKGTQACLSTTMFVDNLHALYYRRYDQNIMYMMPTVKSVQKMCAVSFDPLIDGNRKIFKKSLVTKNSSETKTINGRSISFVGSQEQSSTDGGSTDNISLKSDPCDVIDRDEVDHISPNMIEQSKQRLQRSRFRIERNFGSPTTPNWGIDILYQDSDQRKWQIKCQSCGKYTCLAECFPDSIKMIDGVWKRACVHCGKEIFVRDGHWRAEYPDRREAGFWVSGLLGPYCDLEDVMYRYEHNKKRAEFMRSILGIATSDSNMQLTQPVVKSCCCDDGMFLASPVETCMGVDIGKDLHAVVGIKTANGPRILACGYFDSYGKLHDFAQKMRVRTTVMDSGPYDHGARDYQKSHNGTFLCYYSESLPGEPVWDTKKRSVKVNRNEWCDKVYDLFTTKQIVIPRECPSVNEMIRQLCCTEKGEVENSAGLKRPRWQKRGDDHYWHATLYFLLASSKSSVKELFQETKRYTKCKNTYHI